MGLIVKGGLRRVIEMMKMVKKWWFYVTIPLLMVLAIVAIPGAGEIKPCVDDSKKEKSCYIFYGIAQNHIGKDGNKNRLEVRYLIKGFPYRRHSVYVEVLDENGKVDFLYSEEHTKEHKAHYADEGGLRQYKAFYRIPAKLRPGKYRLRVTFEFDTPGWGRLNRDALVSNLVKFEVK